MRQGTSFSLVAAAAILATAVSIPIGAGGCGGNCSRKPSSVQLVFPGDAPPDVVTSLTTSGACGPAPAGICQSSNTSLQCDAALPVAWSIEVPTVSAGTCNIHVALNDGRVFDTTVTVKHSSDCGGFDFVDYPVMVTFGGANAGAGD